MAKISAQHFPAPWRIEGQFDDDVTVEIRSADDRLVCEIEPFTGEWTEEEIANARLIAGAAERYTALKAHQALDNHWGNCDQCAGTALAPEACEKCFPFADDARLKMRAAIAKTEGRG